MQLTNTNYTESGNSHYAKNPVQVLVREDYQYRLIDLNEVEYFEFYGRNLFVFMNGRRSRLQGNFSDLESRLNRKRFFRINSRYIVNTSKIQAIKMQGTASLGIKLHGYEKWLKVSPQNTTQFVYERSL